MRYFNKIFGIGTSRTGTSTLNRALNLLGIKSVHKASYLTDYVKVNMATGNFLLYGLEDYRGFSDHPIDWLYKELDKQYPNSLFIYTKRKDREAWIRSMHILVQASKEPRDEKKWREDYKKHQKDIYEYFKDRDDFLEIDITTGCGWKPICDFLEIDIPEEPFPHIGKSRGTPMEKYCKNQGFIQ